VWAFPTESRMKFIEATFLNKTEKISKKKACPKRAGLDYDYTTGAKESAPDHQHSLRIVAAGEASNLWG
jgi:hypothetical protein